MRPHCVLLALVAVAACATPADRISSALTDHGLDRERAECIGDRLAADLSNDQLQQIGDAADAYRDSETPDRLTIDDLVNVARAIDDPVVVVAVTQAGIACSGFVQRPPDPDAAEDDTGRRQVLAGLVRSRGRE
ncbi:hypothetical protein C882_3612 [Caenispirillum salinarum AK4]|uniref:Lipoprotein n=1 Tax=Caenispirillum salinarum AK4 TaxID=1238182 RepID=K9H0Q7_9PROT|nr:hypothetical protein [Caenispirillum salinarum]EKV31860.1 hypothetical protein C882_3612 [Caenispirillum salinarum AK4]